MSRLVRFSILLFCSGLLAGCGGSGTDQYQTFQPGEDPLGAAQPTTEPQTPAVAAVAAAAQPVSEAVAGTVSQTSAAMPVNPVRLGNRRPPFPNRRSRLRNLLPCGLKRVRHCRKRRLIRLPL